jgi:hypothetical protein
VGSIILAEAGQPGRRSFGAAVTRSRIWCRLLDGHEDCLEDQAVHAEVVTPKTCPDEFMDAPRALSPMGKVVLPEGKRRRIWQVEEVHWSTPALHRR